LPTETAARRIAKALGQGTSPVKNPVRNNPQNGDETFEGHEIFITLTFVFNHRIDDVI